MNCITKIEEFHVHKLSHIACVISEALRYARAKGVFVRFNFNKIEMLIYHCSFKTEEEENDYFLKLFEEKLKMKKR